MGEWNKLVIPIVGITVSIICLATILMPVINDSSTQLNITSFNNADVYNPTIFGKYYNNNTELIIDSSGAATVADVVITVNGAVVDIGDDFPTFTICSADNFAFRIDRSVETSYLASFYGIDLDGNVYYNTLITMGTIATINYSPSQNKIIFSYGSDTFTFKGDGFFTLTNDKNYYMFVSNNVDFRQLYMSKSLIDSNTGGVITERSVSIQIADDITISAYYLTNVNGSKIIVTNSETYTADDFTAELIFNGLNLVSGTTDVYTGGTPSYKVTYNDDETIQTTNLAIRSFIAVEVPGHLSETSQSNVLWAIPVMVILVILMAAASMIMRNRE